MEAKRVNVAAGVLLNAQGHFLLGQRAENTVYPGYWEFPGGKVEKGESPAQALCRELEEELGITVEGLRPWLVRRHDYEHARVQLHFFEVTAWKGDLQPLVHQALSWAGQDAGERFTPMLPANGPILKALRLPRAMGVTQAAVMGVEPQLQALERALAQGLRLVQIREAGLSLSERKFFAQEVVQRVHAHNGYVLINDDDLLVRTVSADGIHLSSRRLMETTSRPDFRWVGASCHQLEEITHAAALGLDYVLFGPVKQTLTHPEQTPLGWMHFSRLIAGSPLPVFALGGMEREDMVSARNLGAHGVAAIRGAWESGLF